MRKNKRVPQPAASALPGMPGEHGEETAEGDGKCRAYCGKRSRFLESPLCAGGRAYLEGVLGELVPDGAVSVSLEPGGYIDAGEEALASPPETDAAKLGFFRLADAVITVSLRDVGTDGELLARALMARGISGRLTADERSSASGCSSACGRSSDQWIMDAVSGELKYCASPGD